MKVLFVAATYLELEPLFTHLKIPYHKSCNFNLLIENEKNKFYYLVTGVGMISMAYALGKAFQFNKFDFVLNFGIAGSFNKKLNIGDVVKVSSDCFSELGAENDELFIPIDDLNLDFKSKYMNSNNIYLKTLENISLVDAVTVNTVLGNEQSIKKLFTRLCPQIESMEGAAFFYACEMENIFCVQIRAISNYIEKRNKSNWNIPLAIKNLNQKAIEVITELLNR